MDQKRKDAQDSSTLSSTSFDKPNLSMPKLSYSTDSLGRHSNRSRQLSTDHIASPLKTDIPSNSTSQISVLDVSQEKPSYEDENITSDYVEFDLGYQDSKTGVFSSDRLSIIRNDSSKAKLVKKGRADGQKIAPIDEMDKAAQLYKEETATSVFKPDEYNVTTKDSNIAYLMTSDTKQINESPNQTHNKKDTQVDIEEDDGWAEMEATADKDIYDEKGSSLIEDTQMPSKDLPLDGAGSGYTRIAAEEQAEMYKEADRKTDFLFKSNKEPRGRHNVFYDDTNSEDDFDSDTSYDDSRSPLTQLNTTKRLLKDVQKFAYVGLIKLVMNDMATDLAKQALISKGYFSGSKFVKRMNLSQSSFGQWQYKISDRIYSHLELTKEEAQMIESLSSHGIEPNDLSKALKVQEVVENPAFDIDTDKTKVNTNSSKNDVLRPEDISANPTIEIDVAWTVLCDLFLVLLADSVYDSRSRALLLKFGNLIGLDELEIFQFERRITDSLQLEDASEQVWDESQILASRKKKARKKKLMYVGIATIGGSLVLGLSAGLLAPVIGAGIAAGLTTVGIGGTSGFLAGAGGTALVTVTGTAIGARIGSNGMMKRVGDVKTFEFIPLHNNKRVNLIITVSGWMNSKADDIRLPFSTVDPVMGDLFSLLWEPEMLQSTGQTVGILATEALTQSVQQILGATILMALMSAVQIPMALSKLSYILDNPWNVSLDRAWKAGLILADTLISRNLGVRPVTLVGFSLGSRVIYSCLLELAKRGAYGLVEKVVLFGSPVVVSKEELALARSVVSGEYINGFSKKDWILGYLFRATSGGLRRVAGLSPIEDFEGVRNFDCTSYVQGHMEYRKSMPQLLSQLGFQVLAEEFVEIDDPDPEQTERQRQLISEFDEARKQMENKQANGKKKGLWKKWFGPKKKNWWDIYNEDNKVIDQNSSSASGQGFEFDVDQVMNEVEQLKVNGKVDKKDASMNIKSEASSEERDGIKNEEEIKEPELIEEPETLNDCEARKKTDIDRDDHDLDTKSENITMSFA